MIVPFGTFALAAAVTLLSASPVSGLSSLRCGPHGRGGLGAAAAAGAWPEPEPDPLAALATPYVPAATPNAMAAITTTRSGDHRRAALSIGCASFPSLTGGTVAAEPERTV